MCLGASADAPADRSALAFGSTRPLKIIGIA
jgi:hypothetical protein